MQDPTVKIPKIEKNPFLLTELEMANLSIFSEKNDLHPLGVKDEVAIWIQYSFILHRS
jgi:hypothetical protein